MRMDELGFMIGVPVFWASVLLFFGALVFFLLGLKAIIKGLIPSVKGDLRALKRSTMKKEEATDAMGRPSSDEILIWLEHIVVNYELNHYPVSEEVRQRDQYIYQFLLDLIKSIE